MSSSGRPETRKLTVENDDPTSIIRVSDDVVNRLKGSQRVRSDVTDVPQPYQQPTTTYNSPTGPAPYLCTPSLTSIQLRQARIADLKLNDEYWKKRVEGVEESHKRINQILDDEYKRTVEEVAGQTPGAVPKKYLPPCDASRQAVINCYRKYANEPMRCSAVVQAFQQCVDAKRVDVTANRG